MKNTNTGKVPKPETIVTEVAKKPKPETSVTEVAKKPKAKNSGAYTLPTELVNTLTAQYNHLDKADLSSMASFTRARQEYIATNHPNSVTMAINHLADTFAVKHHAAKVKNTAKLAHDYVKLGIFIEFSQLHFYNLENIVKLFAILEKEKEKDIDERRTQNLTDKRIATIKSNFTELWENGMDKIGYNNAIKEMMDAVKEELELDDLMTFKSFKANFIKEVGKLNHEQMEVLRGIMANREEVLALEKAEKEKAA